MTNHTPDTAMRELDRRASDGIDVRLLWNSMTNDVMVAVHDARTDDSFELRVASAEALFAFHHPYAHASCPQTGDPNVSRA